MLVQDLSGRTLDVAAVVPRPADPVAAASWDALTTWLNPPSLEILFRDGVDGSATSTPFSTGALAPALTAWPGHPVPHTIDLMKAYPLGLAAEQERYIRRGARGHLRVVGAAGGSVRFTTVDDGDYVWSQIVIVYARYNIEEPLPSGYPSSGPPWPSDVVAGRSAADIAAGLPGTPHARLVTIPLFRYEGTIRANPLRHQRPSASFATASTGSTGDVVLYPRDTDALVVGQQWHVGAVA